MSLPTQYFDKQKVVPIRGAAMETAVPLVANLTLNKGQWLAQVTAANANDVQTLTFSGAGNVFLAFNGIPLAVLGATCTAAQVQAALAALPNVGAGNVQCTGGAGGAAPIVVTWIGAMTNQPQPVITQLSATGSAACAIVHTTTGVANGKFTSYNGALIANPTAAPVLTDSAGAGTFPAGTYSGSYTFVNANGESLPSPATVYLSAGTKKVHFAAIAGIPAGVTSVNLYIDGQFALNVAVAANATAATDVNLTDFSTASQAAKVPPSKSSLYSATDGSNIPAVFLQRMVTTDEKGHVVMGSSRAGQHGGYLLEGEVYAGGLFNFADFNGTLDSNGILAVAGRFLKGNSSSAYAEFYF